MPIYVYETIPQEPDEKPRYFEFTQSMKDAAFTTHPETGEPIRRVMLGSFGVLTGRKLGPTSGSGSCCSPDSNCCG